MIKQDPENNFLSTVRQTFVRAVLILDVGYKFRNRNAIYHVMLTLGK